MLDRLRTNAANLGSIFARRFTPACVMQRFLRQQDGSAVEFALVATPFFALTFAIMETAIIFFSSQTLETAVADSSRLIMTGQAQTQGFSQSAFKDAVCSKVYGLFSCQSGIYVDVKTFTTFGGVTMTSPIDANGNFVNNFTYNPGGPGEIVVVRLFYQWPVFINMLGLDNMSGGKRLLVATAAFRNEPYTN